MVHEGGPPGARRRPIRHGRYVSGRLGPERDYVEAYTWYTLAMAKRPQVMAVNQRLDSTAARQALTKKMNRHQIQRAEKMAKDWRPVR